MIKKIDFDLYKIIIEIRFVFKNIKKWFLEIKKI